MKIQVLGLKNFRSFENAILTFSDYTVLRGPNRAGKTSVMLGLAWALTGANSLTTRDGKNWDHLIRRGAKGGMTTALSIEEFGHIERNRTKSSHKLLLPDLESVAASANQGILLDRLGVHMETLSVVLDPRPFVTREPGAQRDALTRTLRPPEIKVTDLMKKHGVQQILGVEHLTKLVKEFKEGRLRDMNAESRRLEKIQAPRPKWPFPGKEESDMRSAYEVAIAKRDELQALIGKLNEQASRYQEQLTKPGPEFQVLPKEEYQQKVDRLKHSRERVKDLESLKKEVGEKIAEAKKEANKLAGEKTELASRSVEVKAKLEALVDPVERPAADCPILKAHGEKIGNDRTQYQLEDDGLSKRFAEVAKQFQEADKEVRKLEEVETAIGDEMKTLGQQVVDLQREITNHNAQAAAAAAYYEQRQTREAIAGWNRKDQQGDRGGNQRPPHSQRGYLQSGPRLRADP